MDILIETERLLIRQLILSDDKGMFAMDSDAEVHQYIGRKPVATIEQSRDVIGFIRQQYTDFGIGRWAVIEKETNEFVGWAGLKYMDGPVNGMRNFYDFGYRLGRKFWGKGYATESGRASFRHGADMLQLKEIYAMTDVDNGASRRVLEKIGFKFMGTFNYDAAPTWRTEGEPTTLYKWTQQEQEA